MSLPFVSNFHSNLVEEYTDGTAVLLIKVRNQIREKNENLKFISTNTTQIFLSKTNDIKKIEKFKTLAIKKKKILLFNKGNVSSRK